jgi:hypothetical protein
LDGLTTDRKLLFVRAAMNRRERRPEKSVWKMSLAGSLIQTLIDGCLLASFRPAFPHGKVDAKYKSGWLDVDIADPVSYWQTILIRNQE